MLKTLRAAATTVALVAIASSASAHHSTAEFDYTKTVELAGTVKSFEWTNPHSYILVVVGDPSGHTSEWTIECGAPSINIRRGWTKDSIVPGDKVRMNIAPARDGREFGTLRVMTLANGKQLQGVAGLVSTDKAGNPVIGGQGLPSLPRATPKS